VNKQVWKLLSTLYLIVSILECRLSLKQSKGEFLHISLPKQLSKVSDVSLLVHSNIMITPSDSACNLGVVFDSSLTMSDHISSIYKSYVLSDSTKVTNRETFDSTTAGTIATSLIRSEESYCNSVLNLSCSQLDRLQLVLSLLLVLFLKLLDSPIFHQQFFDTYSGSKLINTSL
jgi:hypothetical protein